ncbi:hypothetical protein T4A_13083 [Trichinella pseudospiralis]|uniref:Uncharacterized protein n=1 Tax=Trichinella pseudospiralis TaxID=6337 RepID=A0A0V1EDC0_TRIPS|nr:hypothetical protein T4A_13083 [Trichinella pseudospiralis]
MSTSNCQDRLDVTPPIQSLAAFSCIISRKTSSSTAACLTLNRESETAKQRKENSLIKVKLERLRANPEPIDAQKASSVAARHRLALH